MLYSQLLPLCYFFKGEVMCPLEYDRKNEGKLWFAEKMICEHLSELVDDANLMWVNGLLILCMK